MSEAAAPFPVPIGWSDPATGPRGADVRAVSVGGSVSDAEMAMQMQLSEMQALQESEMRMASQPPAEDVRQGDSMLNDPVWGEVHFIDTDPTLCQTACFACCPCWTIG